MACLGRGFYVVTAVSVVKQDYPFHTLSLFLTPSTFLYAGGVSPAVWLNMAPCAKAEDDLMKVDPADLGVIVGEFQSGPVEATGPQPLDHVPGESSSPTGAALGEFQSSPTAP